MPIMMVTTMQDDIELLRRYARDRSEEAFAELVGRRLDLVYSAARRQVGDDAQLAEEVAQAVFTDLARNAASLCHHPVLSGWLYRTTRFKAIDALRAKQRRQIREQEAQAMTDVSTFPEDSADWIRLRPILDEAAASLSDRDREAVVLRFYEGRTYAEIGAQLRLGENAARMRVDRALEHLRKSLTRLGFTSTSATLAIVLADQAVTAAPAGLAPLIACSALAGAAAVAPAGVVLFHLMNATKLKIGVVSALLIGGAVTIGVQRQANVRLRAANSRLSDQDQEITRLRQEIVQLRQTVAPTVATNPPPRTPSAGNSVAAAPRRGGQTVPLAAGLIPISSLKDAGRVTPRATFQTQLWAAHSGDIDLTASAITFSAEGRAKLQAVLGQLPQDFRDTYNTPEKVMAFALAGSPHPVGGMQVLGEEQVDADTVVLHTQWQHEDDAVVHDTDSQFQRSADGWRLVVPVSSVDRASVYLLRTAQ
jgi:RNA polymerase sigma factor (sigma-70 family)